MSNHAIDKEQVQVKRPTRTAIWLSAFFPGAGQFVQHKWVRGTLYLIIVIVCMVLLFIAVISPIVKNLHVAMDFADGKPNQPFANISWKNILVYVCLTLSTYIIALIDTINVYCRQRRQWSEKRAKNIGLERELFNGNSGC